MKSILHGIVLKYDIFTLKQKREPMNDSLWTFKI